MPYTPSARIWRALALADLLDAAGIASFSAEAMDALEWQALAKAASARQPSPETRALTIFLLRRRETVRRQLQLILNRSSHETATAETAA